jgi:YCII-related domain
MRRPAATVLLRPVHSSSGCKGKTSDPQGGHDGIRERGDLNEVRQGEILVADGPFAETKEQIAGFDILECAEPGEALEAARKHPVARLGAIELRPFMEA